MKKFFVGTWLVCVVWLFPAAVGAWTVTVPHFLNYQSLLYDDGGNLLADGQAGAVFRVKDANGGVLFEERQTVEVVNGAVSVLVGNGLDANNAPSGGVPLQVLEPEGSKYLEVAVDGYPPEVLMEIVSVPYAVYAEKALGAADEAIGSAAIAKGAITVEHLSDSFAGDLATQMSAAGAVATRTDLTNLQTTYRGTGGASGIGVTSGFVYSGGNNLQDVLRDLDRAIQHRQAGVEVVQSSVTNEVAARTAADTTLQGNINGEAAARAAADAAEAGARDGVDRDHERRLQDLEGAGERFVAAWGTVTGGAAPTLSGFNSSVALEGAIGTYRVSFGTQPANPNYAVTVTLHNGLGIDGGAAYTQVSNKTEAGFTVKVLRAAVSDSFDFIVAAHFD